MASQTPGIQQLLQAEKKASELVSEARKRKTKRLKKAKEEAKVEIDAFKQHAEEQYKEKETQMLGSRDDIRNRMEEQQRLQLQDLDACVARNKQAVIDRILKLTYEIKPELNINYKAPNVGA